MSLEKKEIFEFGGFRLDADEHTIERIDGTVNGTLTEKAFRALLLMVRRRGHLVSRDELIRHVWPDTIVEDNNLEKCVHQIRQFLRETPEGKHYVQTVRKHGYRFVGHVNVIEVSGTWLPETFRLTDEDRNGDAPNRRAESASFGRTHQASNKSGATDPRFGLSKKAVFACAATGLVAIAILLGYFGPIREDVIAAAFGKGLINRFNASSIRPAKERGTSSEEAYQNYQQAMALLDQQRPGSTEKAREYLERAIEIDPGYARAWAGKAYAYSLVWSPGRPADPEEPAEKYRRSMEAANKALSIDPNLPDAYTSLCENRFAYELNFEAAETDCKRAIELDQDSSPAHRLYSMLLTSRGRSEESLAEINRAMELEPSSLRNQRIFANNLYYARRYDEAISVYQRLLDLNPEAGMTHLYLIRSLERAGREADAFDILIKLLVLQKKDDATIERFRAAYASSGWPGVVNERIQTELQEKSPQFSVIAEYYGLLGDKDRAFEYLEKNFQKRGWMKMFLRVDPRFDPIRDDPRFEELVRRVEKSQI